MAILTPDKTLEPSKAYVRTPAVAGTFYPADTFILRERVDRELRYAESAVVELATERRIKANLPKAIITPHAGYTFSGGTAALAYALLEDGQGEINRVVIMGPTHTVAVRGVACCNASAFGSPLGDVPVDREAEQYLLDHVPCMIVNDQTHHAEHSLEVQLPFLQQTLGTVPIVPLNVEDASPQEVGDVIRAFWDDPGTMFIITTDLSHYYPHDTARKIDDQTIGRICERLLPIRTQMACGANAVNGLLDVCIERDIKPVLLGCSTSGDSDQVSVAGQGRIPIADTNEAVVGYASFAIWDDSAPHSHASNPSRASHASQDTATASQDTLTASQDTTTDHAEGAPRATLPHAAAAPDTTGERSNPSHAPAPSAIATDLHEVGERIAHLHTLHTEAHKIAMVHQARQERRKESLERGLSNLVKHTESYNKFSADPDNYSSDPATNTTNMIPYNAGEALLAIARNSIAHELGRPEQQIVTTEYTKWLNRKAATFVTLTENERLRGCVGSLVATRPLRDDVVVHALNAAFEDPRFAPVAVEELPLLRIEVSVLSKPERIEAQSREELAERLHPYSDGVILRRGKSVVTYLPRVWEQLNDPRDFISRLLLKMGLPADYWDPDIVAERYSVVSFDEPEK